MPQHVEEGMAAHPVKWWIAGFGHQEASYILENNINHILGPHLTT